MEKYKKQEVSHEEAEERGRGMREILKEYFPRLPFIHFTTLKVRYKDGLEKSTGVESSFRDTGVAAKTSAVALDMNDLEQSIKNAFKYFYHHAERMNRSSIRTLDLKKARQGLPCIVVIRNTGQELVDTAPIDNPGHVFLDASGQESILAIFKLDEEFSPIPTKQKGFQNFDIDSLKENNQRHERIKNTIIKKYLDALTQDILKRLKENKNNYSQDKIVSDVEKLSQSGLLSNEEARQFKESL